MGNCASARGTLGINDIARIKTAQVTFLPQAVSAAGFELPPGINFGIGSEL
jgi:hypothetical protein